MPTIALDIAGSEATGGAGAQVDIRTLEEHGVFGITALTCIVALDPADGWNHYVMPVPGDVIRRQLHSALTAYDIRTVKVAMLGSEEAIDAVAETLADHTWDNVVVDPVLICKGQDSSQALTTDAALKAKVVPQATFITPNLFEAEQLSGLDKIQTVDDMKEAARRIHDLGPDAVVVKGGVRLDGPQAVDVFFDGTDLEVMAVDKVGGDTPVNGAGCTFAAAVTAQLALGATPREAAARAKNFVTAGIAAALPSHAPVDAVWQGAARLG